MSKAKEGIDVISTEAEAKAVEAASKAEALAMQAITALFEAKGLPVPTNLAGAMQAVMEVTVTSIQKTAAQVEEKRVVTAWEPIEECLMDFVRETLSPMIDKAGLVLDTRLIISPTETVDGYECYRAAMKAARSVAKGYRGPRQGSGKIVMAGVSAAVATLTAHDGQHANWQEWCEAVAPKHQPVKGGTKEVEGETVQLISWYATAREVIGDAIGIRLTSLSGLFTRVK